MGMTEPLSPLRRLDLWSRLKAAGIVLEGTIRTNYHQYPRQVSE